MTTASEPTVLAYMAGIIDSDGFISINRSTHAGRLYHGPIIGVSGTRRQPHDLAASLWGGNVYTYTPRNSQHRTQFQWSRTGRPAVQPIRDVLPFLRVKVEQAELALELAEHLEAGRGPNPFPWFGLDYDPIPAREEMRERMVQVLNQGRRIP